MLYLLHVQISQTFEAINDYVNHRYSQGTEMQQNIEHMEVKPDDFHNRIDKYKYLKYRMQVQFTQLNMMYLNEVYEIVKKIILQPLQFPVNVNIVRCQCPSSKSTIVLRRNESRIKSY